MKRRLTLCIILAFVPLLLLLSYAMSQQSFTLSMEQETKRAQLLEAIIAAEIRDAVTDLSYESLQLLTTQYRGVYSTRQIELIFLYNGHPMDGAKLPSRDYEGLLAGPRSAMLDTRSNPEMYAIADPLTDALTLLVLQDVSGLYKLRSQTQQTFLFLSLGGGAAAAVFSLLIAGWFTRPVQQLTRATRKLSQSSGESVILPLARKDELGELAKSFQHMQQAVQQREAALEREAAKQQALLEALAHEMRTPLCSLLGNARLLEKHNIASEEKKEILSRMAHEIKRLAGMDGQLLKLVELRHGEMEKEPVSILALLQDTAGRLQPQANGKDIQVEGENSVILGDSALLSLMADNLAVNALRASKPGQHIILRAAPNGFSMIDQGVGMDEEQLAQAFEPFYKGDQSRTRRAGGAGLGLSLCKRIAELHGGTLLLSSSPGKGTTASFTTLLQPVGDSVTPMDVSFGQEVDTP